MSSPNYFYMLEKIKGFLIHPKKAFSKERNTSPRTAIKYMFLLAIITATLSTLLPVNVAIYSGGEIISFKSFAIIFSFFITLLIVMYATIILEGMVLHAISYIIGARRGLNQTMKTEFYAGTPTYILHWIPVAGSIISFIWTAALQVVGLIKLQNMTATRSIIAVMITAIIMFWVSTFLFASLVGSIFSIDINQFTATLNLGT